MCPLSYDLYLYLSLYIKLPYSGLHFHPGPHLLLPRAMVLRLAAPVTMVRTAAAALLTEADLDPLALLPLPPPPPPFGEDGTLTPPLAVAVLPPLSSPSDEAQEGPLLVDSNPPPGRDIMSGSWDPLSNCRERRGIPPPPPPPSAAPTTTEMTSTPASTALLTAISRARPGSS